MTTEQQLRSRLETISARLDPDNDEPPHARGRAELLREADAILERLREIEEEAREADAEA